MAASRRKARSGLFRTFAAWSYRLVRQGPRSAWIGRRGERLAARALRRAGYRILGRNVQAPGAEIDIVAWRDRFLVLVEVKTTATGLSPTGRLGPRQQARLRRMGAWLLAQARGGVVGVRYHLVTVVLRGRRGEVTIHEDAYGRSPEV